MAEGYFRHLGGKQIEAHSAGIEAHGLNPGAVAAMQADGVDISSHQSEMLDAYMGQSFDYVITVCDNANERCPFFPGEVQRLHHDFPDPAKATGTEEEIQQAFHATRDEIKEYVQAFIEKRVA
jgi:arsenate reductase